MHSFPFIDEKAKHPRQKMTAHEHKARMAELSLEPISIYSNLGHSSVASLKLILPPMKET